MDLDALERKLPFLKATIALVVGVLVSLGAFFFAYHQEIEETQAEFARSADERVSMFARSLAVHAEALHALGSFFDASHSVEQDEFRKFVDAAFAEYARSETFLWIPRASADRERRFASGLDDDGIPRSSSRPRRKSAFPILYAEPEATGVLALVHDLAATRSTRRLLKSARDSGNLKLGDLGIALAARDASTLHERASLPSVDAYIALLPVYGPGPTPTSVHTRRARLRGFVGVGFQIAPLLDRAIELLSPAGLDSYLFDASTADGRLLYFHPSRTRKQEFKPLERSILTKSPWLRSGSLSIADRRWIAIFTPAPGFFAAHTEYWQWYLLFGGLTITGFVVQQLLQQEKRTARALAANAELERAHHELHQRETQLRQIIDLVPHLIFADDEDGRLILANRALAEMYGTTVEWLVGRNLAAVHPVPREAEAMLAATRKVLDSGQALKGHEHIFTDISGSVHALDVSKIPYETQGHSRRAVLAVCVDVTERNATERERVRLEAEVRESQRLESLGILAGGIAHQFNNLLGAIIGYSELALRKVDENGRVAGYLKQVLGAGDDASKLVAQILTFSRKEGGTPAPIELAPVIRNALALVQASLPAKIEIRHSIDEQAGRVVADDTKIRQVVLNLCTNAYQAIGDATGTLEIALAAVTVDPDLARRVPGLHVGPYVRLRVADTGCGMDDRVLQRIFDPFFTTKPLGEGTGMGLAVVHGIVNNQGGAIAVTSAPGHGSTFDVFLPLAGEQCEAQSVSPICTPAAGEHVLLVDDESALVGVARLMLEELGYRVTALQSSLDALAEFRRDPKSFDAVITDQSMPDMNGSELAAEIMKLRPDVPVILATGYSRDVSADNARAMGLSGYVPKPYRSADLSAALSSALHDVRATGA